MYQTIQLCGLIGEGSQWEGKYIYIFKRVLFPNVIVVEFFLELIMAQNEILTR